VATIKRTSHEAAEAGRTEVIAEVATTTAASSTPAWAAGMRVKGREWVEVGASSASAAALRTNQQAAASLSCQRVQVRVACASKGDAAVERRRVRSDWLAYSEGIADADVPAAAEI